MKQFGEPGRYSYVSLKEQNYSIRFSNKVHDNPPSDLYAFIDSFDDQKLLINKYKAHAKHNVQLDVSIISRSSYEESVLIFNEDYKRFLVKCE